MRYTILLTATLLAAFVGQGSGALGHQLPQIATTSTWMSPSAPPSGTTHPPRGPTITPYTETSSIAVTPTPHNHVSGAESSVGDRIMTLICQVQYQWNCSVAIGIAYCESRFDPAAENSSGAKGLYQLKMPLHAWRLAGGDVFRAEDNVRAAYNLWQEQGWAPWESCR